MMSNVDMFMVENEALMNAIVQVESSGNVFASRYEPRYRYLWDVKANKPRRCDSMYRPNEFPGIAGVTSVQTEFAQQRTSWGPIQVMGAVAREYGFKGAFAELSGPIGMHYGAVHLMRLKKRLMKRGAYRQDDLIAAYNAGSARFDNEGRYVNQHYVDKVNAALEARA